MLLVPASFLVMGASGYVVKPSSNRILLTEDAYQPGGEYEIRKGDVFYSRPVVQAYKAILGGDLDVTIAGQVGRLPAGTDLNVARAVEGKAGNALNAPARVFCAGPESHRNFVGGLLSAATLGFLDGVNRTSQYTQFCLVDADGDSLVEQAFLAGARRDKDLVPVPIKRTWVSVTYDAPLPGENAARIRFAGPGMLSSKLRFDIEIVHNGSVQRFGNGTSAISRGSLPAEIKIAGASFTVLSYDADQQTARIRWKRGFAPLEYSITTTTRTTYIPVYLPR